ncbi:MAG TPA: TniQ family protein [Burkholderiaceae bacterium]|jgi:hypothetical protein
MSDVLLHGVPAPHLFEAPSGWLARLALAQGCSLNELLRFLDLPRDADHDLQLQGPLMVKLRGKCSLPVEAFAIADRVMVGLVRSGLEAEDALLRDEQGGPRFRYCPLCLKQRGAGHFEIHWRFTDWRYCPIHKCLMEERCWNCEAPLLYPRDIAGSVAGREGHASQRRCLACSVDLAAAKPCLVDPSSSKVLMEYEAFWLHNGRALLAALSHGYARMHRGTMELEDIGARAYQAWLPTPFQWAKVERRIRSSRTSL